MSTSASSLSSLLSSASSSSGIDISSILEAATGASSPGIDVTAAVNSAITAAEAPEQAWETQQSTLQSQISALDQIQTDASNLDNDMQNFNSITGPLSAMTVSSSDSNVATASAASGSSVGNHTVVVNSLATTASWTSGTFASSTTDMPAGSFTITSGSGTATTITTDGSETLTDVANEINTDNLGVTASVIVANSTGSAANFTVSGSTAFGFTQAATGADASLTVDGITITSGSNSVTGVIPGVTLSLVSADPGVDVSLSIAPDTSQVQTALQQFVTDYNQLVSDLSTQFTFSSSTGSEGVLASDSTVRNLQNQVLAALDYTNTPASGSTTVPNLTSLGISVDDNGQLSLNTSTLDSALQNNFSDVQSFFQGSALNGFANSLDQQLTSFISPADGAFTVDLQSMNSQITDLQDDINDFQTNFITPLQTQLQADYSQAEIALQELPNQMKEIDQELGMNSSSSS
ncbi:MAG: flagellar filament capping protein FliD [Terracidiphilus sp.]